MTIAAQLAAELDAIQCPHERALRLAEILDGLITCWPDTYDERGYRQHLDWCAGDMRGDARSSLDDEPALLREQAA